MYLWNLYCTKRSMTKELKIDEIIRYSDWLYRKRLTALEKKDGRDNIIWIPSRSHHIIFYIIWCHRKFYSIYVYLYYFSLQNHTRMQITITTCNKWRSHIRSLWEDKGKLEPWNSFMQFVPYPLLQSIPTDNQPHTSVAARNFGSYLLISFHAPVPFPWDCRFQNLRSLLQLSQRRSRRKWSSSSSRM